MPPGVYAGNRLPHRSRTTRLTPESDVSLRRSAISRGSRGRESCPPPRRRGLFPTRRTRPQDRTAYKMRTINTFVKFSAAFFAREAGGGPEDGAGEVAGPETVVDV